MKLIHILNQFFTIKGELGTKFCVSADSDKNNNVKRVEYICVQNTKKLPADWQNAKKRHSTTAIDKIQPIEQKISGLGIAYTPAASAVQVLNTVVPDSMGEEMHNALANLKKSVNDVSGFVAERLQFSRAELADRLAAEQVDAVALAIYNIEARNQGFIIGDQTGVGKGRVAAAMIRYAIVQKHTPVFITEKPNLFTDFYRDLNDIGCSDYRPFIVNAKESKSIIKDQQGATLYEPDDAKTQQNIINDVLSGKKLPPQYDFVMATYSQFSDKEISIKKQFLLKIAEGNVFVLDEAHNAGGSVGKVINGRQQGGSNTAAFFLDIVKKAEDELTDEEAQALAELIIWDLEQMDMEQGKYKSVAGIDSLFIPKGNAKEDIKAREKIINQIYRDWTNNNPDKCVFNDELNDYIYVKFESINETVNKAARSYHSTLAIYNLSDILKNATIIRYDKPDKNNKNQSKYIQMVIMQWKAVKLVVGIKKSNLKIQYCITSLER